MRLQAGTQASIMAKRQFFITIPALMTQESGQKTHELLKEARHQKATIA
jgi:hypothetical protein